MTRTRLVTAGLVAAGLLLTACGGSPGPAGTTATSPAATSASKTAGAATSAAGVACAYPASGTAAKPVSPPPTTNVPKQGSVKVTMTVGEGAIAMTFDRANAPCAVNSFVSLAQQHYFDATTCHRLSPRFVIQCGDPAATGRGGPGYRFADELTGQEKYTKGTVAMANSGPNTNGSQFFIMLADSGLAPNYVILGHVDPASLAVVDAIAAKDTDPAGGEVPLHPINIATVTVS